jgi:hypothetical protein
MNKKLIFSLSFILFFLISFERVNALSVIGTTTTIPFYPNQRAICKDASETIVFFGFIFPTIHGIIALVIAIIATTAIFTGFHNWVYKYNESTLLSVAVFELVNCALAALIRSNVVNIFMHSTNNLMVVLFSLTKMMFAVVV